MKNGDGIGAEMMGLRDDRGTRPNFPFPPRWFYFVYFYLILYLAKPSRSLNPNTKLPILVHSSVRISKASDDLDEKMIKLSSMTSSYLTLSHAALLHCCIRMLMIAAVPNDQL